VPGSPAYQVGRLALTGAVVVVQLAITEVEFGALRFDFGDEVGGLVERVITIEPVEITDNLSRNDISTIVYYLNSFFIRVKEGVRSGNPSMRKSRGIEGGGGVVANEAHALHNPTPANHYRSCLQSTR